MTQTGGLVILYAWLIFAALLTALAYLLLRHEADPLQDLKRPRQDDQDDQDKTKPLPAPTRTPHRKQAASLRGPSCPVTLGRIFASLRRTAGLAH